VRNITKIVIKIDTLRPGVRPRREKSVERKLVFMEWERYHVITMLSPDSLISREYDGFSFFCLFDEPSTDFFLHGFIEIGSWLIDEHDFRIM
jgi:hypothetical protein